ncbi:MAG: prolyl aminopeptidase [Burkholderiales bacterium]
MAFDAAGQSALYPSIEPYRVERVSAGPHSLYVEQCGNPHGFPALFVHGGPGSQVRPQHRQYFDPDFYRVVLFDQRGCGRSAPAGSTEENTTWHLVADIENMRRRLEVGRWLLFGGSWGSTLALAYAQTYPQHVAGLVLRGVFLATRNELEWYLHGLGSFVPEDWQELTGGSSEGVIARYHSLVNHPERTIAAQAAQRWVGYEDAVMALGSGARPQAVTSDPGATLCRAQVQLHYLANSCFLREGEVLEGCAKLSSVPAIIVQGRLDMVCPPASAVSLAQHLDAAQLRIIENAGHSATQPALAGALRTAADDMRGRIGP